MITFLLAGVVGYLLVSNIMPEPQRRLPETQHIILEGGDLLASTVRKKDETDEEYARRVQQLVAEGTK